MIPDSNQTASDAQSQLLEERKDADRSDPSLRDTDSRSTKSASRSELSSAKPLPDEDVRTLLRRFNNQVQHLEVVTDGSSDDLDLHVAREQEFSPDKLRGVVERSYMTIVIGFIKFNKHVARLRSWNEWRRTSWFCGLYFLAWYFEILVPLVAAFSIALITSPKYRNVAFPPIPIALVSDDGQIHMPPPDALRSTSSFTGVPESYKGEAVEAEASHFVTGMARISLACFDVPRTDAISSSLAEANTRASGNRPDQTHAETKTPIEEAMWAKMAPLMHQLIDIADTWERLANALSPTYPFSSNQSRLKASGCILLSSMIIYFERSQILIRVFTLLVGIAVFGQPVLKSAEELLNANAPNWRKSLELRNSILKGIPTDLQLAITLLRIAEAEKAPLVVSALGDEISAHQPQAKIDEQTQIQGMELSRKMSRESIDQTELGVEANPSTKVEIPGNADHKERGKVRTAFVRFLKGSARSGIKAAITADSLLAKAGSTSAKRRQGVVPKSDGIASTEDNDFAGNYDGTMGFARLDLEATYPRIVFIKGKVTENPESTAEEPQPLFSVPVHDIVRLEKIGGYDWTTKVVVSWALARTLNDGLIIVDKRGTDWKLTAMPSRDVLFNRLASTGTQRWESL